MDEPEQPQQPRRRRRTALVNGRWVASAAVIAAMTVGAATVNTEDDGAPSPDTIAYADPPDDSPDA